MTKETDKPVEGEMVEKLTKDLATVARTIGRDEARYLVGSYYNIQDDRMRSGNQERALQKSGAPSAIISWFNEQNQVFERQIRKALDQYSAAHPLGQWARSVHGIGPVIAAGLLAHIDFDTTPGISNLWSFAGQNPKAVWEKGQKRPWNAALRVLCWKIGESFVKHGKHENCVYGHLLYERLTLERQNNVAGLFATQAKEILTKKKIGKTTDAYVWYSGSLKKGVMEGWAELSEAGKKERLQKTFRVPEGTGIHMLPPGHILSRAKRYAVKMFLSHYYLKGCEIIGRPLPVPYIIAHSEGKHTKLVPIPQSVKEAA